MGYDTDYSGATGFSKPLTPQLLVEFSDLIDVSKGGQCWFRLDMANNLLYHLEYLKNRDNKKIVAWYKFLIEEWFPKRGYVGNGLFVYRGDEEHDRAELHAEEGKVTARPFRYRRKVKKPKAKANKKAKKPKSKASKGKRGKKRKHTEAEEESKNDDNTPEETGDKADDYIEEECEYDPDDDAIIYASSVDANAQHSALVRAAAEERKQEEKKNKKDEGYQRLDKTKQSFRGEGDGGYDDYHPFEEMLPRASAHELAILLDAMPSNFPPAIQNIVTNYFVAGPSNMDEPGIRSETYDESGKLGRQLASLFQKRVKAKAESKKQAEKDSNEMSDDAKLANNNKDELDYLTDEEEEEQGKTEEHGMETQGDGEQEDDDSSGSEPAKKKAKQEKPKVKKRLPIPNLSKQPTAFKNEVLKVFMDQSRYTDLASASDWLELLEKETGLLGPGITQLYASGDNRCTQALEWLQKLPDVHDLELYGIKLAQYSGAGTLIQAIGSRPLQKLHLDIESGSNYGGRFSFMDDKPKTESLNGDGAIRIVQAIGKNLRVLSLLNVRRPGPSLLHAIGSSCPLLQHLSIRQDGGGAQEQAKNGMGGMGSAGREQEDRYSLMLGSLGAGMGRGFGTQDAMLRLLFGMGSMHGYGGRSKPGPWVQAFAKAPCAPQLVTLEVHAPDSSVTSAELRAFASRTTFPKLVHAVVVPQDYDNVSGILDALALIRKERPGLLLRVGAVEGAYD